MSWSDVHRRSSDLAFEAGRSRALGDRVRAEQLYRQAAELDVEALNQLPLDKFRTRGILGVSATSLLFKGKEFAQAEELALQLLNGRVPDFAKLQLQSLLQAVWNESAKRAAADPFLPGEIIVSISGGEVVTGGAPLDLILSAVQAVQSLVYRTVEYLSATPLRKRGPVSSAVKDYCRPWLFQAPAGSYQFAIAIQGPKQPDFFREDVSPAEVTDRLIQIIQASGAGAEDALEHLVKDEDYRIAFSKLTRNLAPKGDRTERVRIYSYDSPLEANLGQDAVPSVNQYLRSFKPTHEEVAAEEEMVGTLRALDLDRDWLEVEIRGRHHRVRGLEEAMDDVIGPMVNKKVKVRAARRGRSLKLLDIEQID